ncbi:unnamed protein product, partial [Nesidiocoris tenuis]
PALHYLARQFAASVTHIPQVTWPDLALNRPRTAQIGPTFGRHRGKLQGRPATVGGVNDPLCSAIVIAKRNRPERLSGKIYP